MKRFGVVSLLIIAWVCFTLNATSVEAVTKANPKETFSIQLNVFAEKHNAEKFVASLIDKGYRPYMVTFGEEKILYKVLMGPYPSKEKALQEVHILSKREKLKAIIIPAIYPPKQQSQPKVTAKNKKSEKPQAPIAKPSSVPKAETSKKAEVKKPDPPRKVKSAKKRAPKKAEYDSVDVVVSLFLTWIKAWQGGDAESYLLFYSDNFNYPGPSLEKWKLSRRAALNMNKNISIDFSEIKILQGKDTVEISFVQQYKSDKHADRGHKTLVWKREGGAWRIIKENWLSV